MTLKDIRKIEFNIKKKMNLIKSKKLTPKESNIAVLFNALKKYDEASYENLLKKYKEILKK